MKVFGIFKTIFMVLLLAGAIGGLIYLSKYVYDKYTADKPEPEPKTYTVYFDANGGDLRDAESMQTNKDGMLPKLPVDPMNSDHELKFFMWSFDPAFVIVSDDPEAEIYASVRITTKTVFYRDTKVYALWTHVLEPSPEPDPAPEPEPEPEPEIYTITFDPNGGVLTGPATMQTNASGKLDSMPTDPERTDYSFRGWSLNTLEYTNVTTATVFTSDATVYALWQQIDPEPEPTPEPEPEIYTITFDPNGGTLTDVETIDTNGNGRLPYLPTAPTWDNYYFLGWSLYSDRRSKVTTDTVFTSNSTVYALWTDTTYEYTATPRNYLGNRESDHIFGGGDSPFPRKIFGLVNDYIHGEEGDLFGGTAFDLDLLSFLYTVMTAETAPEEWQAWWSDYESTVLYYDGLQDPDIHLAEVALLEQKLLSFDLIVPIALSGGNYVISKIDFNSTLATEEVITSDMHGQLGALYEACHGTGEYKVQAKALLEANGYTLTDNITLAYTRELSTWDIHNSTSQTERDILKNAYARNMQDPNALDEDGVISSVEINNDGEVPTATFHLRENIIWTDSQGRKVGDFQADDFVAGVQHALDCGNTSGIVGVIQGATEYINGDITDFSQVGISASNDVTLDIQFTRAVDYNYLVYLMNNYTAYTPLCRSYYESQGGKFGSEFDPTAESYTYGIDENHIAYTKYICTVVASENTIEFTLSSDYFDYEAADLKKINYVYRTPKEIPGDETLSFRNLGATPPAADDPNATLYGLDDKSLMLVFGGLAADPDGHTEQQLRTDALLKLGAVRGLIASALDRARIIAGYSGTDGLTSITNILSKPLMSTTENEMTVTVNGTDVTFPAGTLYEEIMQAQQDADGLGVGSSHGDPGARSALGFDGWYNELVAAECLLKAQAAATAIGYPFNAENLLHITLGIVGDGLGGSYAANMAIAIKDMLSDVGIIVDIVYADADADISRFDISLCCCRTPRELRF